jgi:hypothetical protein
MTARIALPLVLAAAACATPRAVAPMAPGASAAEALPFIVDDYPRALGEARAAGRPLFVEVWAPW